MTQIKVGTTSNGGDSSVKPIKGKGITLFAFFHFSKA